LQALADMVDSAAEPGTISIYGGPQPDSADEGLGNRPLLATLSFSKPAFGRPGNGAIGARPIQDGKAIAAGKPTWARIRDGDGNTVFDIDAGLLNFSSGTLEPGGQVSIKALVLRMPVG
jgi:hypothetical protein